MDHKEIEDNDIIDKYLLHQLAGDEESRFEEHLLFCDVCQQVLDDRKPAIALIRDNQLNKSDNQSKTESILDKKKSIRPFLLKIAAFILILLSITFIINLLSKNNTTGKRISSTVLINDSLINKKILNSNENSGQHKSSDKFALAYREMPEFESFIKNNVLRAENITIISPAPAQKVKQYESITIKWTLQNNDYLHFVVFSNRGKLLYENKIPQLFEYKQKLKPGLYYWQLETDEEALFTGKFSVEQ